MTRRALALAVVLACLGPTTRAARAAARADCGECLRAGAGRAVVHVPRGAPLAGYGALRRRLAVPDVLGRHPHAFWLAPATGTRDPITARALVLDRPPRRVVWIALDLVAVDGPFTRALARRLAPPDAARAPTLIVSASHTHSGPGAFVDSEVMGFLAADRLDGSVREALLEGAVAAVRRAERGLRPAQVGVASVEAPDVARSRLGHALDPEIVVLRVAAPDGRPIAALWNYAIHGTVLGPGNLRYSGDVMGAASDQLERALGVPVLFVNGAVGDVSPAGHGEAQVARIGRELASAVRAGWERARPAPAGQLVVQTRRVRLPSPWLSLRNCAGGWIPRALGLPLGAVFGRQAELTAVALGRTAWVTIPGELQTALGLDIKRGARGLFAHVLLAGVSDDYLGYFVSPEDYERPAYVTCASLYGPHGGACLARAALGLLRDLRKPPGPGSGADDVACDVQEGATR